MLQRDRDNLINEIINKIAESRGMHADTESELRSVLDRASDQEIRNISAGVVSDDLNVIENFFHEIMTKEPVKVSVTSNVSENVKSRLESLSKKTGKSVDKLIEEAIENTYYQNTPREEQKPVSNTFNAFSADTYKNTETPKRRRYNPENRTNESPYRSYSEQFFRPEEKNNTEYNPIINPEKRPGLVSDYFNTKEKLEEKVVPEAKKEAEEVVPEAKNETEEVEVQDEVGTPVYVPETKVDFSDTASYDNALYDNYKMRLSHLINKFENIIAANNKIVNDMFVGNGVRKLAQERINRAKLSLKEIEGFIFEKIEKYKASADYSKDSAEYLKALSEREDAVKELATLRAAKDSEEYKTVSDRVDDLVAKTGLISSEQHKLKDMIGKDVASIIRSERRNARKLGKRSEKAKAKHDEIVKITDKITKYEKELEKLIKKNVGGIEYWKNQVSVSVTREEKNNALEKLRLAKSNASVLKSRIRKLKKKVGKYNIKEAIRTIPEKFANFVWPLEDEDIKIINNEPLSDDYIEEALKNSPYPTPQVDSVLMPRAPFKEKEYPTPQVGNYKGSENRFVESDYSYAPLVNTPQVNNDLVSGKYGKNKTTRKERIVKKIYDLLNKKVKGNINGWNEYNPDFVYDYNPVIDDNMRII